MKEEAKWEAKCRDRQIDQFGERLQWQQLLFDEFASSLLASIPCNELRLNAPTFFNTHHTDTTNMDKGICPITYEEFREKAPSQMHLFYSQGRARHGVYKESTLKFYSKHIPREKYREFKCQLCLFYGHIQWSCLTTFALSANKTVDINAKTALPHKGILTWSLWWPTLPSSRQSLRIFPWSPRQASSSRPATY